MVWVGVIVGVGVTVWVEVTVTVGLGVTEVEVVIVGVTVGVTDILGVIVGVMDILGVTVFVTLGVGVGVAFITVGGSIVGVHQSGSSGSKFPVSMGSEESHSGPEQAVPFDPGAFPESKHPPLIKNPFSLVIVKSKLRDTVA